MRAVHRGTRLTETAECNTPLSSQLIRDHPRPGSALPDASTITPPQMLNLPTSWGPHEPRNAADIFPPLHLCSWCSLHLARRPSTPTSDVTLWIWSPEAPLVHVPTPSQKLDVIPKTRKEGREEQWKEKWKKVSFTAPLSHVTSNYYARQNFLFIHLPHFPYKNKGSLKARAMSYIFLYPSQNLALCLTYSRSLLFINA